MIVDLNLIAELRLLVLFFFFFFLGLEVKAILCVFFFFFGDIQNSNSPISLQVPNYQQKEKKKKDTNPIIISLTKKH